jgi:hypothetical protein
VDNAAEPRFCTFKDATWGIRALAVTLITYHDKRKARDGSPIDTVREVIERWAPPHENDTEAYINAVAKAVGVSSEMIVDLSTTAPCAHWWNQSFATRTARVH